MGIESLDGLEGLVVLVNRIKVVSEWRCKR